MHVDAIGTAVDLRRPQFYEMKKTKFDAGFMKIRFQSKHGFVAARGNFCAIDS
jgi:hypothetical protein